MVIEGGRPLRGEIPLQGAKNSVLPILAAAVLTGSRCRLRNCPQLRDVDIMLETLRYLGCRAEQQGNTVEVDTAAISRCDIPEEYMRQLRSSVIFLGALVSRCGQADVAYPGGCDLGARPVDYHVAILRQMGVQVEESGGRIVCRSPGRITGVPLSLLFPSVGATETAILAAVLAEGTTTVVHAAREPEIRDLCRFLRCCGARIRTGRDGSLEIEGVAALHGCTFSVMPDRIAAVTYLAAAAVTGGEVRLKGARPAHLTAVLPLLEQTGCRLLLTPDSITLTAPARLRAPGTVCTMPYPGIPTDAGPLLMAMASVADGTTVFVENIFENRFRCAAELCRLGARIRVENRVAVVQGVEQLYAAHVACTDLRGGAALLTAGLCAQGTTVLTGLRHLDRGYQVPEIYLQKLGACVRRRDV
ncbi:MAG: UDP-N-acetylglucosamine 1-carboxyvinyltransferase [Clostridia bacterium]|nr:UDP-N-acetylglucosamine 1-carboxyvinyltransferase [Clostridia bacterium]